MDSNAAEDIQGNQERKKKSWNQYEKGDRETVQGTGSVPALVGDSPKGKSALA